ncbi:hypothetical protein [Vibrio gazogenes]|uniref:hypothetical protein n=1 Tax=Vibrio gazogenes TaxID=687 RepID=UPI0012FD95AF|nr:hypothetical protein [Vibrio gazogenes]
MDEFLAFREQERIKATLIMCAELKLRHFWVLLLLGKSIWGAFGDAIEIGKINRAPNCCTSTSNLSSLRLRILTHNYVLRFQRHWCFVRQ